MTETLDGYREQAEARQQAAEAAEQRRLRATEERESTVEELRAIRATGRPPTGPEWAHIHILTKRRDALGAEIRKIRSFLHTNFTTVLLREAVAHKTELIPLQHLRRTLRTFVDSNQGWSAVLAALLEAEQAAARAADGIARGFKHARANPT